VFDGFRRDGSELFGARPGLGEGELIFALHFFAGDLYKVEPGIASHYILTLIFSLHFEYLVGISYRTFLIPVRDTEVVGCVNDTHLFGTEYQVDGIDCESCIRIHRCHLYFLPIRLKRRIQENKRTFRICDIDLVRFLVEVNL
jgi:hypothetical protein